MKKIPVKTADALDLIIEFATLGEYGLEYPQTMVDPTDDPTLCRPRRSQIEPATATTPSTRTRPGIKVGKERRRRITCATQATTTLSDALLPPRIKLDLSV